MRQQLRDILPSLGKFWHVNANHIEAMKQIFTELARFDQGLEFLVCGRDNADVCFDGVHSANPEEFPIL